MAGEILANIILRGDEQFKESIDEAGDQMVESAGSAAVLSDALASLGGAASSVIPPSNHAANAIDEVGDESTQTAGRVGILSGSFATLSATSSGLAFSLGLVTTSLTSVAGAIGLITLALAPLLPVVLTAAGAFGALAAIFGAIVGSGIVAWMDATGTKMKGIAKAIGNLVKSFGKQFIPLIKDAVALLPSFIKKIANAVGNLQPFVHALRVLGTIAYRVIPPLIGLFADLARAVLPFVIGAAKWIGKRLVPALDALFDAGMRAAGEVWRLAQGLFNVAKSLTGLAGWVGRFATALYDLAAAALGVGDLTKELKTVANVIKGGLAGAFQWLKTTGVKLAKQAFGFLADKALAAFEFTKKEIIPAISSGLGKAWQWIRTKGVTQAKNAFDFLAGKAADAFEFTKKEIIPAVRSGLKKAWTWIKTKGVTKTKNALRVLSRKGSKGLKTFKQDILPKIKDGIRGAANWIRTKGVPILRKALRYLGRKSIKAFSLTKKALVPKIKKALQGTVNWIRTKGWQIFKSAFRGWGASIGKFALMWLRSIQTAFAKGIPKLRTWIATNGLDLIKQAFFSIGRGIRTVILGLFTAGGIIFQALVSAWTGLVNWLTTGGATKLKNAFVDIISGIGNYLMTQAASDIRGAFEFVLDAAWAAINAFAKGLTTKTIPQLMADIANFIRLFDLAGAFSSMLKEAYFEVQAFGANALQSVRTYFGNIIDYFQTDFVSDVVSALRNAAKQAVQAFKNAFNAAMPNSIGIPSVTIGGRTIGGGAIPLPELHTGGTVTQDGVFALEAGETVVPGDANVPYNAADDDDSQNVNVVVDVRGDSPLAKMIERHIEANEQQQTNAVNRGMNDRTDYLG